VAWIPPSDLEGYPFPVTDRKIIRFLESTAPSGV
jgi:hypothetical protein